MTERSTAVPRAAIARAGRNPKHTTTPLETAMTDRPYTDADLRTEAARQHALSVEDPDFMGIGERMQGAEIESLLPPEEADGAEGMHWDDLAPHDFDAAQRSIGDLLTSAADVSEWAINLGADGLEPTAHTFQLGAQGPGDDDPDEPFVRLHFAFNPAASDDDRDRFVMRLAKVIAANL